MKLKKNQLHKKIKKKQQLKEWGSILKKKIIFDRRVKIKRKINLVIGLKKFKRMKIKIDMKKNKKNALI